MNLNTEYGAMSKIGLLSVVVLGVAGAMAQEPLRPIVRATGLEHAVLIVWDSAAQSQSSFTGYRLYRGRLANGPFVRLREWKHVFGSIVPNQFFDLGDDDSDGVVLLKERLKNDIEYFYRVSAYVDSSTNPPRPFQESFSNVASAIPLPPATGSSNGAITLTDESGVSGEMGRPRLTITNAGNFDRLHAGHHLTVSVTTINTGSLYVFPAVVTDDGYSGITQFFMDFSLGVAGDTVAPGVRQGTYVKENLFEFGAMAISFDWRYEQLRQRLALDSIYVSVRNNDSTDTPIVFRDTIPLPFVGLLGMTKTLGEMEYEIEFLPGGFDTLNAATRRIFQYLNVDVKERKSGRSLQPGGVAGSTEIPAPGTWTLSRWAFDATGAIVESRKAVNRYYVPTRLDSVTRYVFSNAVYIEGVRFVCDYADKGRFLGRPWPRVGRMGTRDFSVGDKIVVRISGGTRGVMPVNATFHYAIGQPTRLPVTEGILDEVRIVPNPYIVYHEAQRSSAEKRIFFQYLPEDCTIRIYTIGLDLVKTIVHGSGGVEQWDLRNERGNLVASQLFIARIEASNGASATKKFAVVTGE